MGERDKLTSLSRINCFRYAFTTVLRGTPSSDATRRASSLTSLSVLIFNTVLVICPIVYTTVRCVNVLYLYNILT